MQSTKRTLTKRFTLGTLLISALAFAGTAEAGDRRTDRRVDVIDHSLSALAVVAAVSGEYRLAHELNRVGHRIEHRDHRRGHREAHVVRNQHFNHHRDHQRHAARSDHRRDQKKHFKRGKKYRNDSNRHDDRRGHHDRNRQSEKSGHVDGLAWRLHLGNR